MNETNLTLNQTVSGAGDLGVQLAQQGGNIVHQGVMDGIVSLVNATLKALNINAVIDGAGLGLVFMMATVLLLWFKAGAVFSAVKVYVGAFLGLLAVYVMAKAFRVI